MVRFACPKPHLIKLNDLVFGSFDAWELRVINYERGLFNKIFKFSSKPI